MTSQTYISLSNASTTSSDILLNRLIGYITIIWSSVENKYRFIVTDERSFHIFPTFFFDFLENYFWLFFVVRQTTSTTFPINLFFTLFERKTRQFFSLFFFLGCGKDDQFLHFRKSGSGGVRKADLSETYFDDFESSGNITMLRGQTALLTCTVKNIGNKSVSHRNSFQSFFHQILVTFEISYLAKSIWIRCWRNVALYRAKVREPPGRVRVGDVQFGQVRLE